MGFIEGVGGKAAHLIKDAVRHRLRDAVLGAAGNEMPALLFHDISFFLAHGAAHQIRLTVAVARQLTTDLHDLLLIDDTTIGNAEDRLQQRGFVPHLTGILLVAAVLRNGVHRPRTVQRNGSGEILDGLGAQLSQHLAHAARFQLEHAGGIAP